MRLLNGMKLVGTKWHYFLDGKRVSKRVYHSRFPEMNTGDIPYASCNYKKAILSDACGVHPDQIKETVEEARRRGVTVDFTKDGRAIFENRQQRNEYLKAFNMFDRDAGYGDPTFTAKNPTPGIEWADV